MMKYPDYQNGKQATEDVSAFLSAELQLFLQPLLLWLDEQLDKRLVRTFIQTIAIIISFRHSQHGLLLSELGGYLLSPDKAPAGTKRISNLLRSRRWGYELIERFLWQRGEVRVQELNESQQEALCIWDESVVEKPESIALEGLCAVRSSKAVRLKRIKPGYFNPPGGRPIFVPGMNWVSLLVMGFQGPPVVTAMRWWTTRGKLKSDKRTEEKKLLRQCAQRWGTGVLHVWDRGFAGFPWLQEALSYPVRFILRWPKHQHLRDLHGRTHSAWKVTRGKRSQSFRYLWDARHRCWRKTGITYQIVSHPKRPEHNLWLVVSRPGKGRAPWYLLTSKPILFPDDAWRIVLAYARRWQVEMSYRYAKSELAMESPRLWFWHTRLKLLLMASLAYAFLLSLLDSFFEPIRTWLLRFFCHRTGKRHQDVSLPLYRLRSALSRLWLAHPPPLLSNFHFLG